jgi:hypothetical protein
LAPRPCVVDTNVALVANEDGDVSWSCVLECVRRLREIMGSGCVAIDDGWLILSEYQRYLGKPEQGKLGTAFLKWVLTHQANSRRCRRIKITRRQGKDNDFEEFPDHPELAMFDPSDRKFVAVAAACPGGSAPILQAADSKWWGWKEALAECGIEVVFLCPQEIAAKHRKKMTS